MDMDLFVVEPDWSLYSSWYTGNETPNGYFVGDEPWDHGYAYEKYKWKDLLTADEGIYEFYGYNWEDSSQSCTVDYQVLDKSGSFNTTLISDDFTYLLTVEVHREGNNIYVDVYRNEPSKKLPIGVKQILNKALKKK